MKPITVTQLTGYIKKILEGDKILASVTVRGELSNYKIHSSGHHYFTLKDDGAVISAVMFAAASGKLPFRPESGMKVILTGKIGLFAKSGQYQIYADQMEPDGVGALYVAFEQLKAKLLEEGLFDAKYKKSLPRYPRQIALVTSPTGAAVQDMIRVLGHRFPLCTVLVCPVKVQGDGAGTEIADMLDYINAHSLADVIITGRGGGSIEDLWAFNEEIVARAIFSSRIPVISAVGHEPDVTIADFVADVRAATPSNAAELAVRDHVQLKVQLGNVQGLLTQRMQGRIQLEKKRLEALAQKPVLSSPYGYINDRRMLLSLLTSRLEGGMERILAVKRRGYVKMAATLDAISPLKVLSRGYAVATRGEAVLSRTEQAAVGERVTLRLSDGSLHCTVEEIEKTRLQQSASSMDEA